jgi:cytochrome c-type biogenesis protein CcmH/NrfF
MSTRRCRIRAVIMPVLLIALLCAALAGCGSSDVNNRSSNYYESIIPQFMCVACHEPLELVSSPEALSEKQTLRGFVKQGMTLSQIKAAMVRQYSTQVLAKPPASGFNVVVYVIPPIVVIAGLVVLGLTLPKWRRRSREAAETELPSSEPLNPDEASRLDSELDQFI